MLSVHFVTGCRDKTEVSRKGRTNLEQTGRQVELSDLRSTSERADAVSTLSGYTLADFLEALTKYVDMTSLFKAGGTQKAEVEEALRYAAATLRVGSPPRLD